MSSFKTSASDATAPSLNPCLPHSLDLTVRYLFGKDGRTVALSDGRAGVLMEGRKVVLTEGRAGILTDGRMDGQTY